MIQHHILPTYKQNSEWDYALHVFSCEMTEHAHKTENYFDNTFNWDVHCRVIQHMKSIYNTAISEKNVSMIWGAIGYESLFWDFWHDMQ